MEAYRAYDHKDPAMVSSQSWVWGLYKYSCYGVSGIPVGSKGSPSSGRLPSCGGLGLGPRATPPAWPGCSEPFLQYRVVKWA